MKSIKKRISLLLCAVMVLSLLTACGGAPGPTDPAEALAQTGPQEPEQGTMETEPPRWPPSELPSYLVEELPPVEYPITWESFLERIALTFPTYTMDYELQDNGNGTIRLFSNGVQVATIATGARLLDHALFNAYVYPSEELTIEEKTDLIFDSLIMCDETIHREYLDLFYSIIVSDLISSSGGNSDVPSDNPNVRNKIYGSGDGRVRLELSFSLERLDHEGNFFIDNGFMEEPTVTDGRFTFLPGDFEADTVYLDEQIPLLLNQYFYQHSNQTDVSHHQDLPVGAYGYHHYLLRCDPFGWLEIDMEAESGYAAYDTDDWLCFQVFSNTDPDKLYQSDHWKEYDPDAQPDFQLVIDVVTALSELCDDGMTAAEARQLFAHELDPVVYDNGMITTVYAPREVVHIWQENPNTGEVAYSVLSLKNYEELRDIDLSEIWQGAVRFIWPE